MRTPSSKVLRYQLDGISRPFSIITSAIGGKKIVTFKKIREIAVFITAS